MPTLKPLSILSLALPLLVGAVSTAHAVQTLPIQEELYVFDSGLHHIAQLEMSGSLIIDHVSRQGYEVYGPKGTTAYLDHLGLHSAPLPNLKGLGNGGYPTFEENTAKLQKLAANFPKLAQLTSIGKSANGKDLWVLKISNNAVVDQIKPEVKLISSMHGDEITGRELLMRLADDLLNGYGKDQKITQLIDQTEIFLLPSMNPDGSLLRQRANAKGFDLNRSFPDFSTTDNQDRAAGRPPEVQAIMAWQSQHNFSLSANYHGGSIVVNYPWDTISDPHPLDNLVKTISLEYASKVPDMANSGEFNGGVTNGYAWYEVNGGMQDWSYYWHNDLQLTIEVSTTKWPAYGDIPGFYATNRDPMIQLLSRVHQGAGFSLQGMPQATGKVEVNQVLDNGTEKSLGSFGFTHGEFYKVLEAGTYRYVVTTADGLRQSMATTVSNDMERAVSSEHYRTLIMKQK